MDLNHFLNLVATLFAAMGSIYVLKGIASLSPNLIERLSRSYVGFGAAQIDSLTAQKADSIVGIALVAIALATSVVTTALVPAGVPFVARQPVAVALALVIAGGTYLPLVLVGKFVRKRQRVAVGRIITAQGIQELMALNHLSERSIGSLHNYARALGWRIEESEQPRQLFERLADAVGLQVDPDYDFSEVEKP